MSSVGVVIAHDDPSVMRAVAEVIDAASDMYVAATDPSAEIGSAVLVVGGEALHRMGTGSSRPVVALARDGEEIRAARAALAVGAREIVRWPAESFRLTSAVRLAARATEGVAAASRVIAVVGARGGVGTTAVVLAFAAIAEAPLVVDLAGGGLDVLMDDPLPAAPLPLVAPDVIEGALVPLVGEACLLRASRVPSDHAEVVRAGRGLATVVLVDAGRSTSACVGADAVVVVLADDVASARGLRALVATGLRPDLVVVRRERRAGVAARDAAAAADGAPWVSVPRDVVLARALDLGRWPTRPTRAMRVLERAWREVLSS